MKTTEQGLKETANIIEAMRKCRNPQMAELIGGIVIAVQDNAYSNGFKDGCDFAKNNKTA